MRILQYLAIAILGASFAVSASAAALPDQNLFFAMDTALRDGRSRSPAEQAALLKELGYDGFGTSGLVGEEALAAFERAGVKVVNTYLTLSFDSSKPGLDASLKEFITRLKGHDTALWIAIGGVTQGGVKLRASATQGDDAVVPVLREMAGLAEASGVKIALYPHAGSWLERVDDALRLAGKVGRPNVGATFNLCHWLKVEGDRDPRPSMKEALPRLFFVSINGADSGDTRTFGWDRLIQPMDAGSYDVASLVRELRELGYRGPIGFQGYGIAGDSREILRRTMEAWRRIAAPGKS